MPRIALGLTFLSLLGLSISAGAENPEAAEVLRRSVAYHDPNGRWFSSTNRVRLKQERPSTPDRLVLLRLPPSSDAFSIELSEGAARVAGGWSGEGCEIQEPLAPEEAVERFGEFDCDAIPWWRDYYSYQLSPPMNLLDAGAQVDPVIVEAEFGGSRALAVTLTYPDAPLVWSYYFDPATYRLLGLTLGSDAGGQDGESILYAGEITSGGVRLPRLRTWRNNTTGALSGTDEILEFESRRE